jgi:hypothetical protein
LTILEGINTFRVPLGGSPSFPTETTEQLAAARLVRTTPEKAKRLGNHPNTFVELVDGESVAVLPTEPDAFTHRSEYYYNSRINTLFKKVRSNDFVFWKSVTLE